MTSTTPPKPSSILPVCSAPDVRTPPEFRVPFRHPFSVKKVFEVFPPNPDQSSPPSPELACVAVPQLDVQATFDARFEQVWTLQKLAVGDLASTMSLAPLERLVLEVKTSQRTTLERTALESSESVESAEATIHDTETVNVARSNTTTTNWHVDGNGSIVGSLGSLNLAGGYSKNVTQTTQYSQNRLNERTQKSASSLKTLHKIEIKGASEAIVEDRQLRILRNPYRDRALTLNFFQLLKHFQVTTSLTEPRLAFVIRITDMIMEEAFIVANVDFLSKHLLDDNLRNNLAQAVEVARPGTGHREQQSPIAVAKTALRFLFKNPPNIFDLPEITILPTPAPFPGPSPDPTGAIVVSKAERNDPAKSFSADPVRHSGLEDSLANGFGKIFTILNFFFLLSKDPEFDPDVNGDNAIRLALALFEAVSKDWDTLIQGNPNHFKNVLDVSDRTEIFRRLSGFLAMVEHLLKPLVAPAIEDADAKRQQAERGLEALLGHLRCNKNYYIQRFLEYQASRTRGQAIVDFAAAVWSRVLDFSSEVKAIRSDIVDFDVDAAFVDKQNIVIPGLAIVTTAQLVAFGQKLQLDGVTATDLALPAPASIQVQVPADGVHLEVAGGACILQDVPNKPFVAADLNFGPSNIKISEE